MSCVNEIVEQINALDDEKQRLVLEFARNLSQPRGISGREAISDCA